MNLLINLIAIWLISFEIGPIHKIFHVWDFLRSLSSIAKKTSIIFSKHFTSSYNPRNLIPTHKGGLTPDFKSAERRFM